MIPAPKSKIRPKTMIPIMPKGNKMSQPKTANPSHANAKSPYNTNVRAYLIIPIEPPLTTSLISNKKLIGLKGGTIGRARTGQ